MHLRAVAYTAALALLSAVSLSSQTPSLQTTSYPNNLWASSYGLNGHIAADLNGDGFDDFISAVTPSFSPGCSGSFAVTLSKGDGSYATPACYDVPSGNPIAFATGDFNNSGNISLVVATGQGDLYWFMNTGVGVLQYRNAMVAPSAPAGLLAADFTSDGNPDLVFDIPGASGSVHTLYVLIGNGDGTFRNGPVTNFLGTRPGALQLGDFDNDNHADVAVQDANGVVVLYGDGIGDFAPSSVVGGSPIAYRAVDLSSNGATDLIGTPLATTSGRGPTTYFKHLDIEYGRTGHFFLKQYVYLKSCTPDFAPPSAADLNGDGINDIIVIEAADCTGAAPWTVNVMTGRGDGSYNPEQVLYTLSGAQFYETHVIRANPDTKPDLVFYQSTASGESQIVALNTTTGKFPGCNPPWFGNHIQVCSPTSTTGASSPVTFSFAASDKNQARDMELWVDGHKVADQLKQAFSTYNFLDQSVALAAGQHHVDVYAKAWDYQAMHTSFDLTVGSDVCPKPASGINVCSPINNSTLRAPVTAYARGSGDPTSIVRMELWVDGAKRYTVYGTDTLKTQVSVIPFPHTFTYYEVLASGQVLRQDVQIFVQ